MATQHLNPFGVVPGLIAINQIKDRTSASLRPQDVPTHGESGLNREAHHDF